MWAQGAAIFCVLMYPPLLATDVGGFDLQGLPGVMGLITVFSSCFPEEQCLPPG